MSGPLWFSEAEVTRLLDPVALVDGIEQALVAVHRGQLIEPRPTRIDDLGLGTNYVAFPSYWPDARYAGCKVLSGALRNPERGLPMIDAIIALTEAETGRIVAVMDGRRITALRTAATTAVAIRHLAPSKGATLGLIGTGAQMVAHAEAISAVLPIGEIEIASAGGSEARLMVAATAIEERTGRRVGTGSPADVARKSDIVVLTTLSPNPVIGSDDLRPDAVVACVGPFRPAATEMDRAALAGATMLVSDFAQRFLDHWASDPLPGTIHDLPAELADRRTPPTSGRRIFFSDGRGLEDLVAARLVFEASEAGTKAGLALP